MSYCFNKQYKHPFFLVIDSPLTPYKGSDIQTNDTINTDIEDAFFDYLSMYQSSCQVIILENKEPNISTKGAINYIHFSGQKGIGRAGFFE